MNFQSHKTGFLAAAAAVGLSFSITLPPAFAQSQESVDFAVGELGLTADLVKAACSEGKLTVYHLIFRSELKPLFAAFNERFPCISIDAFMASGGQLAQRFTTELQAGVNAADVWMNSTPSVALKMASEGILDGWTPPTAGNIDPFWKKDGAYYGVGLANIGIAWNTEEVTEAEQAWIDGVTSWEQVFDSPFADNIGMVDVRAGGSTQLPYYFFRETYGIESWQKLKAQQPTIFNGINPMADRLAAGEFAFTPHATTDTALANRWAQGAALRWKFPEPGLAVPYFVSLPSKAPHPNAAKLFIAWSLSPEGQTHWVNETGLAPASKHATDKRKFAQEDWYSLPSSYYEADWAAIESHLTELSTQFQSVFGQ